MKAAEPATRPDPVQPPKVNPGPPGQALDPKIMAALESLLVLCKGSRHPVADWINRSVPPVLSRWNAKG